MRPGFGTRTGAAPRDIRSILEAGGRIRVLVLDPTDEAIVEIADRRISQSHGQGRTRQRIPATLDERRRCSQWNRRNGRGTPWPLSPAGD
ncbi:hypothetical protein CFP71_29240 [Amycolatopsis thailandensis]|uniref:Uncharacterized protein n=1 Tax=Amycolatopsis thailandensis TaxID=589330 RepID=A0A229RTL3_9PSEU|nr:hypothetical protein CFP71_29240 [Amycolatopsis thailandensis]